MESLMNRLFKHSNLQSDEKLNEKIEKVFENKLFQRIVEKTDVLEDAETSASQSIIQGQNLLESAMLVENPSFLFRTQNKPENAQKKGEGEKPGIFGSKMSKKTLEVLREKWMRSHDDGEGRSVEVGNSLDSVRLGKGMPKGQSDPHKKTKPPQHSVNNFEMKLDLVDFKKKNKLEDSNMTFTDRRGVNNESSRDYALEDLTSKMQQDLEDEPSEIFDNQTVDSRLDIDREVSQDALDLSDNDLGYSVLKVNQSRLAEIMPEINRDKCITKKIVNRKARDPKAYAKVVAGDKAVPESPRRVYLPTGIKFPVSPDPFFPKKIDSTVYDAINIRVVIDRERTGFEESKEFPILVNSVIGARYRVVEYLGGATFSKAIHVQDITDGRHYCLKMIENNKDYFDQSLDEVKILRYVQANCQEDPDRHYIFRFYDVFYYKEHLFLVTELLKDNLYEYYRFNAEHEKERFFTPPRLKAMARQILGALAYLHDINVLHCDVKPENIMVKSYSGCEFRLIDFGSACFIHDHLSSYIQSRYYRAPEVILGCHYDYKIDVWSMGCVLAELAAYRPLFQSATMAGVLGRIVGTIGPFPEWMLRKGKTVTRYFTAEYMLIETGKDETEGSQVMEGEGDGKIGLILPKKTSIEKFVGNSDPLFVEFLKGMLQIDPNDRMTARECLAHRWLN